jgi:hypothetical protein
MSRIIIRGTTTQAAVTFDMSLLCSTMTLRVIGGLRGFQNISILFNHLNSKIHLNNIVEGDGIASPGLRAPLILSKYLEPHSEMFGKPLMRTTKTENFREDSRVFAADDVLLRRAAESPSALSSQCSAVERCRRVEYTLVSS